jgi:predicted RNase H-like HicB family nuclease
MLALSGIAPLMRDPHHHYESRCNRKEWEEMFKYTIVIEKAEDNYCAYCPDLPGCVATGASAEEATERTKEAIEFHIEGLKAEGLDVPPPATTAALVEVAP